MSMKVKFNYFITVDVIVLFLHICLMEDRTIVYAEYQMCTVFNETES